MMLRIGLFELRYQLRQPVFWVVALLFGLLGFSVVAGDQNMNLGGGGNVHANSPMALAVAHYAFNLFFLLGSAALVANAAARDAWTGFGSILFATPLRRSAYVYGRFFGAFAAAALAYAGIGAGMMAGTLMPWLDPDTLGPFRLSDYVYAYVVFGLPGLFLTSAVLFAQATATRSILAVYVVAVAVFILYLAASAVFGPRAEFAGLSAWLDPFGASAHDLATRYWTPTERNRLNPPLAGVLLGNRLLWLGVGGLFLVAAHGLFRPAAGMSGEGRKRLEAGGAAATDRQAHMGASGRFGPSTALRQFAFRSRFEFVRMAFSPGFLILLTLGLGLVVADLLFSTGPYGAASLPTTRHIVGVLEGPTGLITVVAAIYYAGDLIWRDRDLALHHLIDAAPTSDWVFLASKAVALVGLLFTILLAAAGLGLLIQTLRGHLDYELEKYLVWHIGRQGGSATLLAMLALFIQAMAPNRYVGWALMGLYVIGAVVVKNLGLGHYLYSYGSGPRFPLTDMAGPWAYLGREALAKAYWGGFAALLLLAAGLGWRRGVDPRPGARLRQALRRLRGAAGAAAAGLGLLVLVLGLVIYVNTNVWNAPSGERAEEHRLAAAEKTLSRFKDRPQPTIARVRMALELHPRKALLATSGTYVLENRSGSSLHEVHFRWNPEADVRRLEVEGAQQTRDWPEFGFRTFRFSQPMAPGETRLATFETTRRQRGFRNGGAPADIIENGSFISNGAFAPLVGLDPGDWLSDPAARRRRGLPLRAGLAQDGGALAPLRNYVGADWVRADIRVTTDADQTPIAPGRRVEDRIRDGRRTARFVSEAPVLNRFSVQSARYRLAKVLHAGVALEVYHHPTHAMNVPRMIDALKAGLDYYQSEFGDYPFEQVRIVEFPGEARYAQAFANTIAYSENMGFLADLRDPKSLDYVTFFTAHELAHQWWGHQMIGADGPGATLLSETLAEYSALMVIEKLDGPDHVRRFLRHDLDRYLRSRGEDRLGEEPLVRVGRDQNYIHYHKGGHVLYLLRHEIGEAAVNRGLRRLLDRHRHAGPPYPVAGDLVAALRAEAPPDKQALIADLFERITLYDFRAKAVSAAPRRDGAWDVELILEASKSHAGPTGEESPAPLRERVGIGLFSVRPGAGPLASDEVILLEHRILRSGVQTLRFRAASKPAFVVVDPQNRWIDRSPDDNLLAVE